MGSEIGNKKRVNSRLAKERKEREKRAAYESKINDYMNNNPVETSTYPEITVDSSALRYPASPPIDDQSDYVVFKFYKYQPPWGRSFHDQQNNMGMGATGMQNIWFDKNKYSNVKSKNQDFEKFQTAYKAHVDKGKSFLNVYNRADQYTATEDPVVMLYMPDDISTGYKANWGGKSVGAAGRAELVARGQDNLIKKEAESISRMGQQWDRWAADIGMNMIKSTVKGASGDVLNDDDIYGGIAGVVQNPNTELLFQNIDMRTFNLKYRLVPRNLTEATNIKQITNLFKRNMLPGTSVSQVFKWSRGDGVAAGFISVPDLVRVSFMRGGVENPDLPQFKMCALGQVDVNFTPDGSYATYADGNMVATELTLSFQETKLIYKEEADRY
tara:strand:- start:650 stop:1804 length:1155 start_codon:yes stop_codon:yes gene_type:complete